MEQAYTTLATRALELQRRLERQDAAQVRTVIALAGPPGSGKSTIAAEVVRQLNHGATTPIAAIIPMDGFHYPRAYLEALPNRDEAFRRRGVHWTFDANAVVQLAEKLHTSRKQNAGTLLVPSFDHALKDPVEGGISVDPAIKIIILEGSFLLFDQAPWNRVSELADETWFVDVDPELARQRVAARHMRAGIERTWEAALARVDMNDSLNGQEIRSHLIKPSARIESIQV
jgi:pantothenate kinase